MSVKEAARSSTPAAAAAMLLLAVVVFLGAAEVARAQQLYEGELREKWWLVRWSDAVGGVVQVYRRESAPCHLSCLISCR